MPLQKTPGSRQSRRRASLFDSLEQAGSGPDANKYCKREVLGDEAAVEDFFVSRLLKDLGYSDEEIRPKESLSEVAVARGRRRELFRPDYVMVCAGKPRWLIDAKASTEDVDKWTYQGAGYAYDLNKTYKNENPCQYFAITNGLVLKVYKWDEATPLLSVAFGEFVDGNPGFAELRALLSAKAARQGWEGRPPPRPEVVFKRTSVEEVKRIFNNCHQLIWKSEKLSPQPAFFEFVKVMFVKLWEDRRLHQDPVLGPLIEDGKPIPKDRIVFSTQWVEAMQKNGVENPIDTVLFRPLTEALRESVARGQKKPIFEDDERIALHPGTLKQVVARLEHCDMFGIDEDLNGRLFETFLSATMRGEALGQYFTPRSIVKLMVRLADPVASRNRVDRVLDACCGSGGFLIEVLTELRNQIRANTSLTADEGDILQRKVANDSIFGIDAGREPPLARIARINMYLHGDGGSRIYAADSLDKSVRIGVQDDAQSRLELDELGGLLRGVLRGEADGFDIALTNPPFSMGYSENLPNEREILQQYALTTFDLEQTSNRRKALRSAVMFIERYAELLKSHGRLVTVIDDSILSSTKHDFVRDFIRDRFVVRAIISLPGDAFQRVGARAKTSILYLVRRAAGETGQPDVFMAEARYVGLDDVPMKTRPSKALEARSAAQQEIEAILQDFRDFLSGKKGPWLVPAARIADRLDVKWCLPRQSDIADGWRNTGTTVLSLEDVVDHIEDGAFNPKQTPDKVFTLLRVRYDGIPEEGDTALGRELTYDRVQCPSDGDLVVSNIAAHLGSCAVIPADLQHTVLSSEFTIMRVKDDRFQPWFIWAYLRSAEVRARLLSSATGISRHRIGWGVLKDIPIPLVDSIVQEALAEQFRESMEAVRRAEKSRAQAAERLNSLLDLDNEWAEQRLKAAKPPK